MLTVYISVYILSRGILPDDENKYGPDPVCWPDRGMGFALLIHGAVSRYDGV